MHEGGPVPGRECGDCVACCVVFDVPDPIVAKAAGVPCQHLAKGGGCGIYEHRPQVCSAWLCGWRLIPGLPENWRPDLSGILIYQMRCPEPDYNADAFILALSRGLEHLRDGMVLGFVESMVKARLPLYLTLHAGKAEGRSIFLNRTLEPVIAAGDRPGFVAAMVGFVEKLQRG